MKPIRSHSFTGKSYPVTIDQTIDGYTADGATEIAIRVDLKPRAFLETAVHEATHALVPNWNEEQVARFAREMARWLWRLGYRR